MTRAYYNEIDPHAAQWLRNLIDMGLIAFGDVDERDIRDITPNELRGYTQCHFFAGIGVWSYALRLAGWPDDRPVWTGSPPCQPFSAAGRRAGVADERHLWPHWHYLISECRPEQVFGEQVASQDGLGWLDLVQSDMEGSDYACGAVDLCAAGVGAPHIRQRQFFFFRSLSLGHADRARTPPRLPEQAERQEGITALDDDRGDRLSRSSEGRPFAGGMDDVPSAGCEGGLSRGSHQGRQGLDRHLGCGGAVGDVADGGRPSPTNGFWRDADWLFCRDDKWRPVEPRTFPLVDGSAFRLDSGSPFAGKSRAQLLKGAGNAIVSEVAAHVVAAFLEAEADQIAALDARGSGVDLIEDLL